MASVDLGSSLHGYLYPLLMGLPRVAAALLVMPLLPAAIVPRLVKAALVMVFVLAVYPHLGL